MGEYQLDRHHPGLVAALLETAPRRWLRVARRHGIQSLEDDPVPDALIDTIHELDLERVREALRKLPLYRTPKGIAATVERVRELWRCGEKVVVFCHFRATGAALRSHISRALETDLRANAARTFGIRTSEVPAMLHRLGESLRRRADRPSKVREAAERELRPLVSQASSCSEADRDRLLELLFRYLRSPVVLARYGAPL